MDSVVIVAQTAGAVGVATSISNVVLYPPKNAAGQSIRHPAGGSGCRVGEPFAEIQSRHPTNGTEIDQDPVDCPEREGSNRLGPS